VGDVVPGPITPGDDGTEHFSQPLPTVVNIPIGGRALLRISTWMSAIPDLASLESHACHRLNAGCCATRQQQLAYDTIDYVGWR